MVASVLTITALSLDRYIAINHPMLSRRLRDYHHPKVALGVIWVLAIIASSPLLVVQSVSTLDVIPGDPILFCRETWPLESSRRAYGIFLLLFIYLIPGSLMIVLYTAMGKTLWSSGSNLRRQGSDYHTGNSVQQRRKVARVSAIVAVVFAVCWLPYHITSLTTDLKNVNSSLHLVVLQLSLFLGHVNSGVNPVLYCFIGKTFRKRMKQVLRARYERRKVRRLYQNQNLYPNKYNVRVQ